MTVFRVLKVTTSLQCVSERSWIINQLLNEYLGVRYTSEIAETKMINIEAEGRSLSLSDTFFSFAAELWLSKESLPTQPLKNWDTRELGFSANLTNCHIPIIYGNPGAKVEENSIRLGLDIFGSAFFMLSRYEEAIKPDRDSHDRFPSSASLAYREEFLDRPIVNEYLEILWSCIRYLWPGIQRIKRESRQLISVDVDLAYQPGTKSVKGLVRQVGGDLFKRNSVSAASRSIDNYLTAKRGDYCLDPYYNYLYWIMVVNEEAGNRVAYYFRADRTRYSLDEPVIRKIFRDIYTRGHEIGLHSGYDSYLNPAKTSEEANSLRQTLEEESIDQTEVGGRQHYLRWATPNTANNLENAGLAYDSTLAYADRPGFRCGTCYEYTFFDVLKRKPLELRERPLIIMEDLILKSANIRKDRQAQVMELMKYYKDVCEKFNGDFTLLWHNSYFCTAYEREIYVALL